jgi:hypothetical protein
MHAWLRHTIKCTIPSIIIIIYQFNLRQFCGEQVLCLTKLLRHMSLHGPDEIDWGQAVTKGYYL